MGGIHETVENTIRDDAQMISLALKSTDRFFICLKHEISEK
jgi:hypothetical protein